MCLIGVVVGWSVLVVGWSVWVSRWGGMCLVREADAVAVGNDPSSERLTSLMSHSVAPDLRKHCVEVMCSACRGGR